MGGWKLLSRYNTLDYGSISETIYALFIKLAPARNVEIERDGGNEEAGGGGGGEGAKQGNT